jgi:galactokinase
VWGSAPGRLDLLGGVADYAGALVLEMPTRQSTNVVVEGEGEFVVGPAVLSAAELARWASLPYEEVRRQLVELPRWTHYVIGVAVVLLRHGVIGAARGRVEVRSDLPESVGAASSAALEVATARALGAGGIHPLRLATLCQEAENQVVGAPCGIMDQVAVALGVPGAVLPVLCRPASVETAVTVPDGLEVVGWPTGAAHDVSGVSYRRARAAAFMGKRMVEDSVGRSWAWGSELPADEVEALPEVVGGSAFLDRWGDHGDDVTSVSAEEWYPVRAATRFGGAEHDRCRVALPALRRGDALAVGACMAASQAGYDAMGLGHPTATTVVGRALARPGVHGARSSGGGCGGTVVVLCEHGALDDLDELIR